MRSKNALLNLRGKPTQQELFARYKLDGRFLRGENVSETLREIRLPADLCRDAEEKFGQQFANIEEFIVFVLHAVLNEGAAAMDEVETHIVEERLRDLGYI